MTTTIEVFYTRSCPHCPAQKELAQRFETEDVTVRLTDASRKQGRAQRHGVRSVPTTIISGPGVTEKIGFTGVMTEDKLATAVKVAQGDADPDALKPDSILTKLRRALPGIHGDDR